LDVWCDSFNAQNLCGISVTAKNLAIDWLNYLLDEGASPSL
jgi:hypothetical protein